MTEMDNLEFENLTAEELRAYRQSQPEDSYLLIDVRQPAEYEQGHIPGARLMPLPEVESGLFTLPADRDLIFYCQNGARSQWAASLAGEGEVSEKNVYNLMNGLLGWEGKILPGYPRVKIFEKGENLEQLLTAAMDLEKGAWRFYQYVMERYPDDPMRPTFEQVAISEKAHAGMIYRFWQQFQNNPPPFDSLYQELKGNILEGGQSLDDACRLLDCAASQGIPAVIELAMTIEYRAFDLYRSMAEQTKNADAGSTFLSIAQAEKAHLRALTRALNQSSASGTV
jgi:rubrerythrin/rhodanese-related sulfurtransferase